MLVATLEYYCVIPIIRRERISYVNILNIICLFSITATIYYILTYGQATIDSDIAMPSFLDQTIWKTKSLFPTNWAYVNGDIWVISIHLFVLPFTILLKNQSLARMLGASLLFMSSLAGIYYQDKKIYKNNLKLVLAGKKAMEIPKNEDIIELGFISETEKINLLKKCKLLVLPSQYESLSLSTLEAMYFSKPVLLNGKCEVLKDHVILSNGGLYYENKWEFLEVLNYLIRNSRIAERMGKNGKKYIDNNYRWDTIMKKLRKAIN